MAVAYHLAAAQGPAIEETVENSVIILIAVFNRMAIVACQHGITDGAYVPVSDPKPGAQYFLAGGTNHYWFDLNRQWLIVQHPEPKGWVAKFHEWRPNINRFSRNGLDSTYYFHPGA